MLDRKHSTRHGGQVHAKGYQDGSLLLLFLVRVLAFGTAAAVEVFFVDEGACSNANKLFHDDGAYPARWGILWCWSRATFKGCVLPEAANSMEPARDRIASVCSPSRSRRHANVILQGGAAAELVGACVLPLHCYSNWTVEVRKCSGGARRSQTRAQ